MLRIHIIRNIDQERARDDIITIRQNMSRDFVVNYSDNDSSVRYSFIASRDNLIEYLWSVFDFLRIDEEPFDKVQIVSPVHPSILMNVKTLDNRKVGTIMKAIRQLVNNWPRSLTGAFSHMYEGI
jgi:hypothetical protein